MKLLLPLLISLFCMFTQSQRTHSTQNKTGRDARQLEAKTTVVSCRVFKKGVCKRDAKNIITTNTAITNSRECQQYCYSTAGCAAFIFFEDTQEEPRKCVLVKDCNGKLSACKDCISGPIMPRINECLAAKQEVTPPPTEAPKRPCAYGCTQVCVGPRCQEFFSLIQREGTTNVEKDIQTRLSPATEPNEDRVEKLPNEENASASNNDDNNDTDVEIDENVLDNTNDSANRSTQQDDTYDDDIDPKIASSDDEEDETFEAETMDESALEEEAIQEEEEEVADEDINIDAGFLKDGKGNNVTLGSPIASTVAATGPTFIFYFCAFGGSNEKGPVSSVDVLFNSISSSVQALSIAPIPAKVTQGSECSAAYTGESITTCSSGYSILSPYGYVYNPGSCLDYSLNSNDWKQTGAKLTTYRKGGTLTKLGRYLMAVGGSSGKKYLKSIELFDPKAPEKGWKKMGKLTMPSSVSEHCTVTVKGRSGKELMIIGGKGRENRLMKLDINSNKWYSLNHLNKGRRNHACVKATLNGRSGVVVSGGINQDDKNMTSVEFYDAGSGSWYNLPSLRRGRRNHVMVVNKGRLMVAGGMGVGRKGKEYLEDIEVFTGERWVKSNMKLDRPRANFSLVRIPRNVRSVEKPMSSRTGQPKSANGKTTYRKSDRVPKNV